MDVVTACATTHILALDSGSSSLKFAVYEVSEDEEITVLEGAAEGIGTPSLTFWIKRNSAVAEEQKATAGDPLLSALTFLETEKVAFDLVVHRIVFGGADRNAVERVDDPLISELRALETSDPLHLPAQIRVIEAVSERFPQIPQYASFDTAFHATMPDIAKRLPIPRLLHDEGVRRYGYHGLSYASIVAQLDAATLEGRVLVAHLGSGCSMAAIRGGSPIDTTMGFTPLGGLMMGTRAGDLDPGVLLYLLRKGRHSAASLEALLENDCGLRGVSGTSADMRSLLSRSDEAAAEAVSLFAYLAGKAAGSLVVAMGGLDTLIFTGGIGERSAAIRRRISEHLRCFGVKTDGGPRAEVGADISSADSGVKVLVLQSRETRTMARLAFDVQRRIVVQV